MMYLHRRGFLVVFIHFWSLYIYIYTSIRVYSIWDKNMFRWVEPLRVKIPMKTLKMPWGTRLFSKKNTQS